jgi:ATP-dependent protease HslVU (ClpYQ) peptidase subunit
MTVIAYRDGVMAGDSYSLAGATIASMATKVLRRQSDGALIGCAGCAMLITGIQDWFLAGENGERPALNDGDREADALIARPDGRVEEHNKSGFERLEGPFFAIGSGIEAALAAMHAGCGAVVAAEIACKVRSDCGGLIRVVYASSVETPPDA